MTKNEKQRIYRLKTNNKATKKYEKSMCGFIMRLYRNMKSRICGVQKQKWYLYKGKYLLPKRLFYIYAVNNKEFINLYTRYKKSGFNRKLAPSINRINSLKGYELNNIEFITNSENSRLGGIASGFARRESI